MKKMHRTRVGESRGGDKRNKLARQWPPASPEAMLSGSGAMTRRLQSSASSGTNAHSEIARVIFMAERWY